MIGSGFMSAATLLAFVGGLVLLWLGWRGRRLDDHPWCRWCKFDLYGRWPGASLCPECGSVLSRRRAVRTGRQRKRPALLIIAALILAPLCVPAGQNLWHEAVTFDSNKIVPTWWLVKRAENPNSATPWIAIRELLRRLLKRDLSPEVTAGLIEAGLRTQADPESAWSGDWGDFIEYSWNLGLLSDDQKRAYIQNAYSFDIATRASIAEGDLCPLQLIVHDRVGAVIPWPSNIELIPELLEASIQSGSVVINDDGGLEFMRSVQISAPPGTYSLHSKWRVRAFSRETAIMSPGKPFTWACEFDSPIVIEPAGMETVSLLKQAPNQVLAPAFFEPTVVVRNGQLDAYFPAGGPGNRSWAFELIVRDRDREWVASEMSSSSSRPFAKRPLDVSSIGFDAHVVDLILRPSIAVAKRTVDITRIWDQEIVFKDVPVNWIEDAAQSAPADPSHAN